MFQFFLWSLKYIKLFTIFINGELWHQKWQLSFGKNNIEKFVGGNKTDILLDDLCIEIQNSLINQQKILCRNKNYTENGKKIIWIINVCRDSNNKIQALAQNKIKFISHNFIEKFNCLEYYYIDYNGKIMYIQPSKMNEQFEINISGFMTRKIFIEKIIDKTFIFSTDTNFTNPLGFDDVLDPNIDTFKLAEYQCKTCGKNFNKKCNYISHCNRKTSCLKNYIEIDDEKVYKCSYCDRTYSRIDALHRHLESYCNAKRDWDNDLKDIRNQLANLQKQIDKIVQ